MTVILQYFKVNAETPGALVRLLLHYDFPISLNFTLHVQLYVLFAVVLLVFV